MQRDEVTAGEAPVTGSGGRRRRVAVVGGGFGGLAVARGLRNWPGEVMVIDRTNHHLFQPLLYQVATAALSPGDIAVPIRQVLRQQKNATVLMATVEAIDTAARTVRLADGGELGYDALVLAVGARHGYFGHAAWERDAPGLKTLDDALQMRERLLAAFEHAERLGDLGASTPYLTFAVIGAGPTGVEMAGAIAEIAHQTMLRDFRRIDTRRTRVVLVEAGPRVLPAFPPDLGAAAERSLAQLGVEVLLGQRVVDVDQRGVLVEAVAPSGATGERRRIDSANVIWAAGNEASTLVAALGCERDRQGRAVVGGDCSIAGHAEVFVIGDAACFRDPSGQPLAGVAQVAMQQGAFVADLLRQGLGPGARPTFRYVDKGIMATIGKARAVARLGRDGLHLTGWAAWLAWSLLHVMVLVGFRNRFVVFAEWVFWYFTGRRGVRLISRPPALSPPPSP